MLEGINFLSRGWSGGGIHTNHQYSYLTITSKSNGLLFVKGGGRDAAIGGKAGESAYNITIEGGIISVINTGVNGDGHAAAAIGGGGNGGGADNIVISGGTVSAYRSDSAPIIGGGNNGSATNIKVTGGSLMLYGGATKFSTTPVNADNVNVYELKCFEAGSAKSVKIDEADYPINGNHYIWQYNDETWNYEFVPDPDPSLYFWLTGADHTIVMTTASGEEKTYVATWKGSSFSVKGTNAWLEALSIASSIEYGTEVNPSAVSAFGTVVYQYSTNATGMYDTNVPSDVGTYYVKAKVEAKSGDDGTYDWLESTAKSFTITKATPIVDMFDFAAPSNGSGGNPIYSGSKKEATVSPKVGLTGVGDITIKYYKEGTTTATDPIVAGEYTVKITVADGINYKAIDQAHAIGSDAWTFTIDKATPSETPPTSLTATYGKTLADIALPSGWVWNDATTTSVGNVSSSPNTFAATFTPADINNYNTVVANLSVTVSRATLTTANFTYADPTDLVYSGSAKAATVTAKPGLTGIGSNITIKYYKDGETTDTEPIAAGHYIVKIDVTEGDNYNSITDLEVGSFTITPKKYAITIDPAITNGTVIADKQKAIEDETVTLTVTPATGYERDLLSYTTGSQTETITDNTFLMPADDVTVTATFKTSSVPPVNPPVDPDDPDPVRYTVTLPTVEGATTDPAAGNYEVDSWGSFSFLLTLDEGYQKDSHPVVTARGKVITPNASNGKYIISYVSHDIAIEISGIIKDIATGNDSLSEGFHIATSDGLLLVTVPRVTRLYLTDTSGRLILTRLLPAGDTRIEGLAAGIYILTLEGEKGRKVILK